MLLFDVPDLESIWTMRRRNHSIDLIGLNLVFHLSSFIESGPLDRSVLHRALSALAAEDQRPVPVEEFVTMHSALAGVITSLGQLKVAGL